MTDMLQKRYEGYLKTPFLWKNDVVFNLLQFNNVAAVSKFDVEIDDSLRLGKYVERFVAFELRQQKHIRVLAENIQIQQDTLTLGELDCLLLQDEQPIHLEIIYKFYLYDALVGTSEIEHFVGPNRKDALIEKLSKLKHKQLPLIYTDACKPYLKALGLAPETILQQVYFKAQLFLPFANQNIQLKTLNNDCVVGYYITRTELIVFKDCKFYVPTKKDWLITPHTNVDWLNFKTFTAIARAYFEQKYSTLIWVKLKTGMVKKVFLVWW